MKNYVLSAGVIIVRGLRGRGRPGGMIRAGRGFLLESAPS